MESSWGLYTDYNGYEVFEHRSFWDWLLGSRYTVLHAGQGGWCLGGSGRTLQKAMKDLRKKEKTFCVGGF